MPVQGPSGSGFGPTPFASDSKITKRAAPITASAFNFSLTKSRPAPAPPVPGPQQLPSAARDALHGPHAMSAGPSTHDLHTPTPVRVKKDKPVSTTPSATPLRSIFDVRTPHRPFSPSNEPVTDVDVKTDSSIDNSVALETPRRISIIKPLNAFSTPTPKQQLLPGTTARKINDFTPHLTTKSNEVDDGRPKKPLQAIALPGSERERVADDLLRRRKREMIEEDEGVGVSPRGKRIAKWAGKGAQPPSVRLANLLSSANASLQLFHTAMQHTLDPAPRRSSLDRQHRTHKSVDVTTSESITPFQHVQTAPVRLRLLSPLPGPTHYSAFFWCEVVVSQPSTMTVSAGCNILVVFPPVPVDSPRLGLDPRMLARRIGDKRCQAGVWASSQMRISKSTQEENANTHGMSESDCEEGGMEDETIIALLATRYLIAEEHE